MDLSQLTSWLKLPQRVLWALLCCSALLLWGPDWFVSGLGLEQFIATYRMYLGVAFLLLLAATLPTPIQWAGNLALEKWRSQKLLQARRAQLKDLTPEEKEILRNYIEKNTRSQYLDAVDGVTARLEGAGIIYRAANLSHAYTDFAYNIQPWAWEHLRENPHLLGAA